MSSTKLWIYSLVACLLPESRCMGFKCSMLRWAGVKVGKNVVIYSSVTIMGTGRLEIDDGAFIGTRTIISSNGGALIHIGKEVAIGPLCYIATGAHLIDPVNLRTCGDGYNRDIIIEDGAWLAVHSVIVPGIMTQQLNIGNKALVLPGSIVSSNVPNRTMVGVPGVKNKGEL